MAEEVGSAAAVGFSFGPYTLDPRAKRVLRADGTVVAHVGLEGQALHAMPAALGRQGVEVVRRPKGIAGIAQGPGHVQGGDVGGVFTAVIEHTQRVLSERRLRTLRELADRTAEAKSDATACESAAEGGAEQVGQLIGVLTGRLRIACNDTGCRLTRKGARDDCGVDAGARHGIGEPCRISGEQYALPEAVGLLRETRRKRPSGNLVSISAADPLNLVGILTPGPRLPALTGNRLLFEDGVPAAVLAGGAMQLLVERSPADEWELRLALLGRTRRADRQATAPGPSPSRPGRRPTPSNPRRLH